MAGESSFTTTGKGNLAKMDYYQLFVRERPFSLKGGYGFFLKNIMI
jgi:hypothetical protein